MTWLSEVQLDNLRRSKGYKIGKNVKISDKTEIVCEYLEIGDNSRIDAFSFLSGFIVIGKYTHIGSHCVLSGNNRILMGSFVGISSFVYMFTANADYSNKSISLPTIPKEYKKSFDTGKIHIASHNIIGAHSTIFPNTMIFKYSKFGCYSLIKGIYDESRLYVSIGNKTATEVKELPHGELDDIEKELLAVRFR